MIYDKPRDINLRVFPSLSSFAPEKRKKTKAEETKQKQQKPEKTITENFHSAKPVTPETAVDFQKEPIIDISSMPIVDGVPMLELAGEVKTKEITNTKTEAAVKPPVPTLYKPIIDISEMPDIEGIPLLKLPEEIRPEVLEEKEEVQETPKEVIKTEKKEVKAPPVIDTKSKNSR